MSFANVTLTEHLLVPLDESAESERALPVAIRFAEALGATVGLVAVNDDGDQRVDDLTEYLRRLAAQCGAPVESFAVLNGAHVATELAGASQARPGTLIVMNSRGPSRTSLVLTESVAAELLAAGESVVIVGPRAQDHPDSLPVVACFDGTDESAQVLPLAVMWAQLLRVSLILVIVAEPHLDMDPTGAMGAHFDPETALQGAIAAAAQQWPTLDVRGHIVTYPWNVADALSTYLDRHPAQIVAVATHVRGGWDRLMHPSSTARIVHQLPVPVLVVPIEEADPGDSDIEWAASAAAKEPAPRRGPVREVIVPADDDTPEVVTEVARALAAATGAELTLVTPDPHAAGSDDVAELAIRRAAHDRGSVVCVATAASLLDMLGSTGRMIRWSPRPVVLVGPHCRPPAAGFTEIVGCVDGSLVSEAVADLAAQLAGSCGVTARLLSVEDPDALVPGSEPIAQRYVGRLAGRAAGRHQVVVVGETVLAGDVADALCGWAREHPSSLLVMASHGDGLSHRALGAVVMAVVHGAPTAVVVIPAHALIDKPVRSES